VIIELTAGAGPVGSTMASQLEEASTVSDPNFDSMTKDEVIAWFRTTDTLAPAIRSMTPSAEPAADPVPEIPMMLASIRIPVPVVEEVDRLADEDGVRRSDVIREALGRYIMMRRSPVSSDEAQHALDVLRRVVTAREDHPRAA
jgi:predicted transcriptional regulator